MRRGKLIMWVVAATLLSAGAALPAGTDALKAADDAFIEALNGHDAQQIAAKLHGDFVYLGAGAEAPLDWASLSAEERLAGIRAVFTPFKTWKLTQESGVHYQVFGDTGIVAGVERQQRQGEKRAPEMIRQRFTRTWQHADSKWLLIASHRSDFAGEALTKFPLAESDAERKIIEVAEAAPRHANVTLSDARVLRMLAELSDAKSVLEFGTSTGYSGLWFSNALRKTGGKLTTFELDAGRAAIARGNFKKAGVGAIVTLVEGDAHKELAQVEGPVDLVFIDAEKPGYRQYLEQVLPLVRPGGMIIGHNMRFPTPYPDFVEAVTTNPVLDTVFIHMHDRGMSLSLKKR